VILNREDGLTLSDDIDRLDLDQVQAWLGQSYWAAERDRATIERSVAGSRVYGVYASERQVAFARAVTDGATFCWIADVYVEASQRGRGIGRWLVASILEQLGALGVQRFVLATRDAHGVFEQLGFEPLRVPATWMEIDRRANRPGPGDVGRPSSGAELAGKSGDPSA
jgi:GNAT superfamily N-acetyltransferase